MTMTANTYKTQTGTLDKAIAGTPYRWFLWPVKRMVGLPSHKN